jgi:acyl carrier protein
VIDSDIELTEQGLDSMSLTALISELESSLKIDIDPDIIFEYPLPDQLIDEIHSLI